MVKAKKAKTVAAHNDEAPVPSKPKAKKQAPHFDTIPMGQIVIDRGTQSRAGGGLDPHTVAKYRDQYEAAEKGEGTTLPPVLVFFDGRDHILTEGFHRYAAFRAHKGEGGEGWESAAFPCEVHYGTLQEAVIHSCGANDAHGLPRTGNDIRHAVQLYIKTKYAGDATVAPVNEVARACKIAWATADKLVKEVIGSGKPPAEEKKSKPKASDHAPKPGSGVGSKSESNGTTPQDEAGERHPVSVPVVQLPLDRAGLLLPMWAEAAFREAWKFDEAARVLDMAGEHVADMCNDEAGGHLRRRCKLVGKGGHEKWINPDLENARKELKAAAPYSAHCPYCRVRTASPVNIPRCKGCSGLPFVTRATFDRACESLGFEASDALSRMAQAIQETGCIEASLAAAEGDK